MRKILFILLLVSFFIPALAFGNPSHSIAKEAELTKIGINLRTIGGGEKVVVFSVTLKNTTNTPLVYNVMALVDNKMAGVGIIPADEQGLAKAKPGEEVTGQVAVTYDRIPTNFVLTVGVEK